MTSGKVWIWHQFVALAASAALWSRTRKETGEGSRREAEGEKSSWLSFTALIHCNEDLSDMFIQILEPDTKIIMEIRSQKQFLCASCNFFISHELMNSIRLPNWEQCWRSIVFQAFESLSILNPSSYEKNMPAHTKLYNSISVCRFARVRRNREASHPFGSQTGEAIRNARVRIGRRYSRFDFFPADRGVGKSNTLFIDARMP